MTSEEAISMLERITTLEARIFGKTKSVLMYEECLRLAKFGMAMERSLHKYLSSFASMEEMGFGGTAESEKPLIDAKPSRLPRKMQEDLLRDIKDVISHGVPVKKVVDA